jgi:2-C-methyl-D-erythritol 4-phosphate cytidylyltransferase
MQNYVVIVAGGKGLRMGSEIPKQFIVLKQLPILMHTLSNFHQWDNEVNLILVLPENQREYWTNLCAKFNFTIPHHITNGGETRFHSVLNGLKLVPKDSLVAIHDAVRPFVSKETIQKCFDEAKIKGNAIPFTFIPDSLRWVENGESKILNRDKVVKILTPQVFQSNILHLAFQQPYQDFFTDDASVIENIGQKINLVEGNPENIKITTPNDLIVAEAYLKQF